MNENPYTTPQTQPQNFATPTEPSYIELASRWARLGAAAIDGIIMMIIFVPLVFGIIFFSSSNGSMESLSTLSYGYQILITVLAIAVYVGINGYFLVKSGQTVGKKVLGIQIVSHETHQLLTFGKVIGIRYIATVLIAQIPFLGKPFNIIDTLFIFGAEKRCIHDLMAGTIVIKSSSV